MAMDDPFQYLTFGGTFGRSLGVFVDRFDLFMAISAIAMIPFGVILVSIIVVSAYYFLGGYDPDTNDHAPAMTVLFGLQSLIYALTTVVGQGAMTNAVAKIYIGAEPQWLECLKAAWARKWSLLCASLLVHGAVFLTICLLAVAIFLAIFNSFGFAIFTFLLVVLVVGFLLGGFYAYSALILTSSAIMVEGFASPTKGIKRSWELSTGSRCYLICTMISFWFFYMVVNAFLHNLFGSDDLFLSFFSPVDMVVRIIPLSLFFPLHSIIETVLYLNLRVGRESMNHQVLSGDLMAGATMNDASLASRIIGNHEAALSEETMDYRQIPLMDNADNENSVNPPNTSIV